MGMKGARAHINRLKRLQGEETVRLVGQALFAGAETIQVEIQRLISEGAVSGAGHVRSLPGEPPNYEFGDLSRGVEATQIGPLHARVSSNAPHASPLEFSTSRMAARPSVIPARDNKRREVVDMVQKAVSVAVKRSGR